MKSCLERVKTYVMMSSPYLIPVEHSICDFSSEFSQWEMLLKHSKTEWFDLNPTFIGPPIPSLFFGWER
jgi:hypothetical protein